MAPMPSIIGSMNISWFSPAPEPLARTGGACSWISPFGEPDPRRRSGALGGVRVVGITAWSLPQSSVTSDAGLIYGAGG